MTTTPAHDLAQASLSRRRPVNQKRKAGAALSALATLTAVWFGFAAPSISPVAAPATSSDLAVVQIVPAPVPSAAPATPTAPATSAASATPAAPTTPAASPQNEVSGRVGDGATTARSGAHEHDRGGGRR